ncbi:MAG: hypothetical protein HC808_07430 [Candidatus Competibacteraceae bacterium]|nr:hypothetical protein [Candidatus Competibacteraceae bacterium]
MLGCLITFSVALGSPQEQRVQIGLRLFRTLLAADQNLAEKVNAEGRLELMLLYRDDRNQADEFAKSIKASGHGDQQGKIKQLPLQITPIDVANLEALQLPVPAAIYLVQPLPLPLLKTIIQYGIDHRRIVFSPFAGDVENGVLAGFAIGVRVRPYINRTTLERSGIELKSLLLKVAKIYD